MLIAPAPDSLPPKRKETPAPKLVKAPAPRLIARPFVARATAQPPPQFAVELLSAPRLESPALSAPTPPELPRVAPPIETGTFSEALTPLSPPRQLAKNAPPAPTGFATAETSSAKPQRALLTAGQDFDAASAQRPGSHPTAPARTAGFGEASTSAGAVAPTSRISRAAFGDAALATPTPRGQAAAAASPTTPVEILEKPRPAYTDEARRLSLEGEVLLEVCFTASGEARVLRIVRTLGHGLDETAAAAARSLRFRPARREGVSVDSTAVVHIVFQLAY
jgi:TonB family protein